MLPIWLNLPLGFLTVPTTCCKCSCLSIFYMHDLAYACLLSLQCTPLQFVVSLALTHPHNLAQAQFAFLLSFKHLSAPVLLVP